MRWLPYFFCFVLLFWFFFFLLASTCVNAYGKAKEKELLPSFDRNKICHGWVMLFKRFFSLLFSFFCHYPSLLSFFYRMPTKNRREILKYNAWVPKQNPPSSWFLTDATAFKNDNNNNRKKSKLDGGYCVRRLFFFILYNLRGWITNPKLHFLTLILIMVLYIAISFYFKWIWSHPGTFQLFCCFRVSPASLLFSWEHQMVRRW